jgi:hypothetical protein
MNMKRNSGFFGMGALTLAALLAMGSGAWAIAGQGSQEPSYTCSIKVPEPEPANLTELAKITADQAMAAAQAAYPGAQVKKVALENENGCLIYAVDLSNGLEIKVDAGDAKVLHSEKQDEEREHEGKHEEKED